MKGNNMVIHVPVMLSEAIDGLRIVRGESYVDATLGMGGHTREILKRGGIVIGLDTDEQALAYVRNTINDAHLTLIHGNFSNLTDLVKESTDYQVSGVLMDLGTSALQLADPARGMSFQHNAPLDMRMTQSLAVKAKDLVNGLSEKELYELFTKYAQEQRARPIARALVRARALKPIETTGELAGLLEKVYRGRQGRLHPATKVFQALRIAVNDEINNLKQALPQTLNLIKSKGRLVIISFHEGEDREVKLFFSKHEDRQLRVITPKPLTPSLKEVNFNSRSRSAKLRIAEIL